MRDRRIAPVIGLLIACCGAAAPGPVATRPARPLSEEHRLVDRADERVSVLDNGLTVILKAHRTAPVVSVRMYCRTGSIYEQEYLGSGMSHLFEHLLHGGETMSRPEEESRRILDEIGGNTNAYTTYDHTCYFINTVRDNTGRAVSLLGDWITRPTFPQAAFEREWNVVQRELERDVDDPETQLHEMLMQTVYQEHPIRYPVIGFQPIVQKLTKEDIVGYYRRMYVPDNIVICIAGDIELDATLSHVRREFASFARQRVPTIVLPQEPPMVTPRSAVRRMQVPTAMMQLAWPSIPLRHPDLYALDVLSYVLTQGDSSRLVRTVRDPGLVYTVASYSWTPAWANGVFAVSSRLAPDKLEAAREAILGQIASLHGELVSEEELLQAQNQKAAEHVFAAQTAENVAEMMAQDYLSTGDVHFSQAYVDGIRKVTREQIREVARKYLVPARLATVTVLPETPVTTTQATEKAAQPDPVRRITLDNGVRCLIRRDPTTPLVAIQAYALGGVLMETPATNGFSRLAALTAPRGTPTRSAEEIARFFDAVGGSMDGASANNTIFFQSQVLRKDFAGAMEVFSDVVCNASFPADELEAVRPRVLEQIDRINEAWRSELIAYLQSRLFTESPYRMQATGSKQAVTSATRDQIEAFYRRCLTGPNTVVAIFGDVDAAAAEALVRRHFTKLPPREVGLPEVRPEPRRDAALFAKAKPPTRNVAGVGIGFRGMSVQNTDEVATMAVLDTVMSGYRYPTGWLHDALRGGTRSLVYEVHAQNAPGPIPGYFLIYAACEPDKVNEVYGIVTEALDRARAGRFTPEEIERARTIITTTELMENQTSADRAMQAAIDELYGLGYDYRPRFLERVRAVTPQEMQAVAAKYFTAPTIAVVTPEPAKVEIGIVPAAVDRDDVPEGAATP